MSEQMSVIEALVLQHIGWRSEEERRLYAKSADVLHAAGHVIRFKYREYPEPRAAPPWTPPEQNSSK